MRILSWNLWNSFKKIENPFLVSFLEPSRRREKRYLHQLKLLHQNSFDVVFFQEVNPVYDKVRDFKEILGYQPTYQVDQSGIRFKRIGLPLNFQNALVTLTKEKQKKIKGLKLSGSFGTNEDEYSFQFGEFRYALFSEIKKQDNRILLVNTHFHHGIEMSGELLEILKVGVKREDYDLILSSITASTDRKKKEIEILLTYIQSIRSQFTHVIVAGDFNFSQGADLLHGFSDLQLHRVEHQGYTWEPEINHENFQFTNVLRPPVFEGVSEEALNILRAYDGRKRTMDHIFVSANVNVKTASLFGQVTNKEGYFPSDHFGITVDIDL